MLSDLSRADWLRVRTFVTYALMIGFFGTVVGLLYDYLTLTLSFDPQAPPPPPKAHAIWIAVLWLIAVVPVIGMVLRRGWPRIIWGLLLAAGLAVNLLAAAYRAHEARLHPDPVPAVTQCQEHSGGDTRCPGG